ncbi:hypothetical protein ABPG74_010081 [Tetrahymena malaccensis]
MYDQIESKIDEIYGDAVKCLGDLADESGARNQYDGSFFSFTIQFSTEVVSSSKLLDLIKQICFNSGNTSKSSDPPKVAQYIEDQGNQSQQEYMNRQQSYGNNSAEHYAALQIYNSQQNQIQRDPQYQNHQRNELISVQINELENNIKVLKENNTNLSNKFNKIEELKQSVTTLQNQFQVQFEYQKVDIQKNYDKCNDLNSKLDEQKLVQDKKIGQITSSIESSQQQSQIKLSQFQSTIDVIRQELSGQNSKIENIDEELRSLKEKQIKQDLAISYLQETVQKLQEEKVLSQNVKLMISDVKQDQDDLISQSSQIKQRQDIDEKEIENMDQLYQQLKQTAVQTTKLAIKLPFKFISFFSPFNLAKKALSIIS